MVNKMNLSEFKMRDGEFEIAIRTEKYRKDRGGASLLSTSQPVVQASVSPPHAASNPVDVEPQPDVAAAAVATSGSNDSNANYVEVKSPIVGTFYRSPGPDKPAYIKVGDSVEVGSVVCIVEAMKLFNEIESEVSGKVVKVLLEDASPVEYDQVLFLVDPNG